MLEIIKNTLISFYGIPSFCLLFLFVFFYEKITKKEKANFDKGFIKIVLLVLFISFAWSSFKYFTKEYDSSETKLHYDLNSDAFYAIGYDNRFEKAILIFKEDYYNDDGMFIEYIYDLPADVWKQFRYSESLGNYYNKYIKGRYNCYKNEIYEHDGDWARDIYD